MKKTVTIVPVVLICLLVFACNSQQETKADEVPAASTSAKTSFAGIELSYLDGRPLDWTEYKGKPVFVNFWATWCKPCVEEMPSIQKLKEKLKEGSVAFLLASDETPAQIEKFRERYGYDLPFVRVNNIERLGISAIPTTYIFDQEGKLVFSEMGYRQWDNNENTSLLQHITGSR